MLQYLLAVHLLAVAAGCFAAEPSPVEAERLRAVAALSDEEVLQRSIQWLPVGGSALKKERRMIGWGIDRDGWGPALKLHGEHIQRANCRGLWVNNPWGHDGVWPMEWDQRLILRELSKDDASLEIVDETFLPEFRKFLAGEYTGGKRPHVWFYLGTNHVWQGMEAYRDRPQEWWDRARESCQPILTLAREFPGQVSIASDRSYDLPQDHPHYKFLTMLASTGMEVIIEPRPGKNFPHLFNFGCVVRYGFGINGRQDVQQHIRPAQKFADDEQIRGSKYALLKKDFATIENARKALERGYTPIVGTQFLREEQSEVSEQ